MIAILRSTSATLLALAALSVAVADERPTPAERPAPTRAQREKPGAGAKSKRSHGQKKAVSKRHGAAASDGATGEKKPAKPCEEVKPCAID